MVRNLDAPLRPLPTGGATSIWRWRSPTLKRTWEWCRVYHRDRYTPDATTARTFGPLYRFDPHTAPADAAAPDADGRSVLYVGVDLETSACEVFGEVREALLCPQWRVAKLRPTRQKVLFDLTRPGTAMAIGALPSLADGPHPRALTQQWARAIYEDDPAGAHVNGIRYKSAYNGDFALALWDSAGSVTVAAATDGTAQDLRLTHPGVFGQLQIAMQARGILVTTTTSAGCKRCRDHAAP